jgi:hypothetical protein
MRPGEVLPVVGEIYTIRAVTASRRWLGEQVVKLVEISNPPRSCGEVWYQGTGFRPIVERKTDISVFEEILRRESIPDECIPAEYGVDWGASA